jgi:hypothetical protein
LKANTGLLKLHRKKPVPYHLPLKGNKKNLYDSEEASRREWALVSNPKLHLT